MTSCLLVKAPDRIIAVSDGRLSVAAQAPSFDTASKIRRIAPTYQYPIISVGRFSHFAKHDGEDWFISFAGTYALVSEIIGAFQSVMNSGLFLVRDDYGAPLLSYECSIKAADDSYNFRSDELIRLGLKEIVSELRSAVQQKCDQWSSNRGIRPDCEFLLFGKEPSGPYAAAKVRVSEMWTPGRPVRLDVEKVEDGNLTAIGSTAVAGAAFGDAALTDGLKGWRENQSALELRNSLSGMALARPVATTPPAVDQKGENWSADQVSDRFAHHIQSTSDPFVGGDLILARGGWHGAISLERRVS